MHGRSSRRRFVQSAGVAGLGLLAGCGRLPGQAPPAVPVHRLGWLVAAGSAPSEDCRQALAELGYVEGQTVVFEFRSAEGHEERLPALAAELVRLPVDLLLVEGDPPTRAAQQATRDIPIVMALANNPLGTGLIPSLAPRGGNVTGVARASHQLAGKRLQLLQEVQPALARVGVLWRVGHVGVELGWHELQDPARTLGLALISLELRGPEDFDAAFAVATREHAEALLPLSEALMVANHQHIIDFAARSGLLTMSSSRRFVQDGGLMAYGANPLALFRRAAAQVDRILKGTKPADVPVEQPMLFDFALDLRTAQVLGLTIPERVLLQVTEVIQ